MQTEENLLQNELIIDTAVQLHLKETAMWAKFLSIMGFVFSGIIALIAIFAGSVFSKFTGTLQGAGQSSGLIGIIMFAYFIVALILFFMSLYLYKFATKMQLALRGGDQQSLTLSFQNLKVYYRFAGIITIIYLGIFLLVFVGGIITALAFHS